MASIPRPDPQTAARMALANRKALLILDGAEAADDLDAVLQVAGTCGVLITTRRHSDAPDEIRDLEPLPRSESLDLLRAWADDYAAEDAAANDTVRLLGGLPLALFLVGRYLAQRRQKVLEYAAWLQEQGLEALHFGERPSRSVPLLLRRSLEQVSDGARAAFGVAGVLALAPFDAEAAAGLEVTVGAAHRALGELVDYGLLLRPGDRYQVTHALAHGYARTAAAPDAEVVGQLALHYAGVAARESARGLAGYAVLDGQRAHLVAVQSAALGAGQWDAVREITWKVEDYLDLMGYFTDRQTVIQAGLTTARGSGARSDEAEYLNRLGLAYADLGETRRAIEYQEQCLVMREIGDRRGEGAALGNLAESLAAAGRYEEAGRLYRGAIAMAVADGNRYGEGVGRTSCAALLCFQGEYAQAQRKAAVAAALAGETANAQVGSEANATLALAALLAGDGALAGRALAAGGHFDYPPNAAELAYLSGILALRQGEPRAARARFAEAAAATAQLATEAGLYAALELRALAGCGLAVACPLFDSEAAAQLQAAVADLRAARRVNADAGTVAQFRLRYGLVAARDSDRRLAEVARMLGE